MADVIEPGATLEGSVAISAASAEARRVLPSARALALGGVIGWSAFLLFLVEPMIGRLVLPVFGGTPAVWATTLCFFQVVLLLGYLYGHLSATRLGAGRGAAVHIALVVAAAVALAIAPSRVADLLVVELPDTLNLLFILVALIGLPAFVLTTTTPLVSSWVARAAQSDVRFRQPRDVTTRTRARSVSNFETEQAGTARSDSAGLTKPNAPGARGDAYWLYALSNAGSLAALLAYPFVVEPRLGLAAQRGAWAIGFVIFALAITAAAAWARRRTGPLPQPVVARPHVTPIDAARRVRWLLLAAVPSGLLNAVTTYIATDLVSAPLLWLVPLAIYLGTFIVAFSERGRRLVPIAATLAPAAITLMWVPTGSAGAWPIVPLVALMYGGLAVVATALHGRLALDRPPEDRLTEFYLLISVGGAAAAIFVAILAPIVFPGVWELPILLVLALVALAVTQERPAARTGRRYPFEPFVRGAPARVGSYAIVAAALVVLLVRDGGLGVEAGLRWLLVGGLILLVGARPIFLAVSTAFVLSLAVLVLQPAVVFRDRSFFGVTAVLRPADSDFTVLMNGTTSHGIQSTDPARAGVPEAYYARPGPFGDVFRELAAAGAAGTGPKRIAAVGLGAGAIATYLQPGWSMDFYEIDPLVAAVASDPRYFTYLSGAAERPRIVLGDARLSLRDVPTGVYDAIAVDAFSSDSIPAHLLTTEAVAEYARVVRPGGLILVHVSNRYYDLAPAVAAAGAANGLPALRRVYVPSDADRVAGAAITEAVVLTTSPDAAADLRRAGWTDLPASVAPMTDDFMDLLRFLRPIW